MEAVVEKWLYWVSLAAFGIRAVQWRHRALKGRVLSLLVEKGEQTGMELKDAGAPQTVYNYLKELEEEGLIERRENEAADLVRRGGLPQFLYRAKGAPMRSRPRLPHSNPAGVLN
jgi:hypothetical protein